MADIIQLLPDSIANQIAAGEVIQRPASVVKELIENSVDAEATEIRLIIKDAGKTLIQVVDNGKGMTDTDARMSFERHATSKIKEAADLFSLTTKGFRGEALASIAAIAQVEMITRTSEEELGTVIVIEGSQVKKQDPCQAHQGTSFSVKNLFYNVPARRKFLKSEPVEFKHIIEELHRVALAHPEIFFSLHHNGNEVYHLPAGNLRQRVISIFGKSYNEKIVPISEETDMVDITGFIGKPEAAKRSKGEQYFFVNDRFIKSHYLHHAVRTCYDELIAKEQHPFYCVFLTLDPRQIDINVHPTKTEIKFEEERLIYNYLKVATKHALAAYNVTPAIDFNVDYNFSSRSGGWQPPEKPDFGGSQTTSLKTAQTELQKGNRKAWQELYDGLDDGNLEVTVPSTISQPSLMTTDEQSQSEKKQPYQLHNSYIITQIKSGFLIIDQQAAHERILYENYLKSLEAQGLPHQKSLFPQTIELTKAQAETLKSILDKINMLGFDLTELGNNSFVIHGTPIGMEDAKGGKLQIEQLIAQYEENLEFQLGINENLARSMAFSASIKRGTALAIDEMTSLIDQLFACSVPYSSPSGRKCLISMDLEDIKKRFISL